MLKKKFFGNLLSSFCDPAEKKPNKPKVKKKQQLYFLLLGCMEALNGHVFIYFISSVFPW